MNVISILVTALCIGLICLSIYIAVKNIKNQLDGKGCGNCHGCNGCSDKMCSRKK